MPATSASSTTPPRPAALGDRVMNTRTVPVNFVHAGEDRLLMTSLRLHELAGRTLTPTAARERAEETVVIAIDLDGGHQAADQSHDGR